MIVVMKKILLIFFLLCWPLTAHAWLAKVVSVIDGDTIKVFNAEYGQVKIRLYGIDSPEKGQPYGQAAGKHLVLLIAGSTIEVAPITKDRYGRTVGVVLDDGKNINQEMVQSGYAWVYPQYCDKPFCDYWLLLENQAKISKLGLWQEPNQIPPWELRRTKDTN